MALANYSDLVAAVATWMVRSDLSAVIPDFIAIAEARINADVRLREGLVSAALATVPGDQYVTLPDDWLEFKSISVSGKPLRLMTIDRLREFAQYDSGPSTKYAIEGTKLYLSPSPGTTSFNVDVVYYAKVPALSTATTNWLMTKYPNIYLYASLVSGYHFLMNDDRADYFGRLYTQAVNVARAADTRAHSSGSPLAPILQ